MHSRILQNICSLSYFKDKKLRLKGKKCKSDHMRYKEELPGLCKSR